MAGYDHWKSKEPDAMEWELRSCWETCDFCGADVTDPCEVGCACDHCRLQRLRVLDVDPENEGKVA